MTLGVAVVGLGMAHKPHIKSLRELSDAGRVRIMACYSPTAARREAFGKLHPDLPQSGDLEAILADPKVDAVVLLTPPMAHLEPVLQCAAAGKHVLVEKPLDYTVERARQSVDAMANANRRFAVMLQHRFRVASRKLISLVQNGDLGELISGSASIRWWRTPEYYAEPGRGMKARDGGGVLITQAIHTLDLFQSLTGPIARVAAMARTSPQRTIDSEDIAAAAVSFRNGAIGTIDATTVAYPGFPERIELACTKATAVLEAESLAVYYRDGKVLRHEGEESKSGGADPMAFPHEAHKALMTDFFDAIEQGREPVVSGREALNVLLLIEALLKSSETGQMLTHRMIKPRVFLTHTPAALANYYGPRAVAALREMAEVVVNPSVDVLDADGLVAHAQGCAIVVSDRSTPGFASFFDRAPDLVAFLRCAVDIRNVDVATASRHGILVTHATPGFVASVAELGIGMMIDLARHVSAGVGGYRSGEVPVPRMGRQLQGSSVGLIGYGVIAEHIAKLAKAFGMKILAADPYKQIVDPEVKQVSLETLLEESDFVICLAVATDATENLMNAAAFARMRSDAFFINLSRGNLVDETALKRALDENRIAGAAMDVGRAADQMPSLELARHPRVIATPHTGGLTPSAIEHQAFDTVGQVRAILAGGTPPGAVNMDAATRLKRLR